MVTIFPRCLSDVQDVGFLGNLKNKTTTWFQRLTLYRKDLLETNFQKKHCILKTQKYNFSLILSMRTFLFCFREICFRNSVSNPF